MGVAGIAYGLVANIWVAIALVTLTGLFNAPTGIGGRLVIQRNTPREQRFLRQPRRGLPDRHGAGPASPK
jgi:hypothetical protein